MNKYTATIQLTPEQDAAFDEIAAAAEKTKQQIIDEITEDRVKGQIHQWIHDQVRTELGKMDAATALSKLRA